MATDSQDGQIGFKHEINLSLPFPTPILAQHAASVIKVDRELRPLDVVKHFHVVNLDHDKEGRAASDGISQDAKGALLNIKMQATTLRHLRISTNALLEDLSLIIRTMDQFLPQSLRDQISSSSSSSHPSEVSTDLEALNLRDNPKEKEEEEEQFEQGKVGLAG